MIKRLRRLIRRIGAKLKNSWCYHCYRKKKVDRDTALFTSKNGSDLAGNMLRLMRKLREEKPQMTIYIAVKKDTKERIESFIKDSGIKDIKPVEYNSFRYLGLMETAGYLFCDSTLPVRFVKRPEQIYVNTWHGTPLKMMGNDSASDRFNMGNVQKNFIASDYLVYPSDYCRDKMLGAYSLDRIYGGTVLLCGYPRNDVFYDAGKRDAVRSRFSLEDKRVYVYMPTFREGAGNRQDDQVEFIASALRTLDGLMGDGEVLFVKLHVFVQSALEFETFSHVRPFPGGIESYEFLNACDCLVSDYSSVMYDFANTRRKIVRFVYDEADYYKNRGLYRQPVEMPFTKTYTVEELYERMSDPAIPYDDTAFYDTFCMYEKGTAARTVIRTVLADGCTRKDAERKNTLIYDQGITGEYVGRLLNEAFFSEGLRDGEYLAFRKASVSGHTENFANIPKGCRYVLGINTTPEKTFWETVCHFLYRRLNIRSTYVRKVMDGYYRREAKRLLEDYRFEKLVFYRGYSADMAEIIAACEGESVLYVYYDWFTRFRDLFADRLADRYDRIVAADSDMARMLCAYADPSKIEAFDRYTLAPVD